MATATVSYGLADGEAESGTLDEIIEFYEPFEYAGLLVGGNADAGVFAVEVEAGCSIAGYWTELGAVADADVALPGVFAT